jgi:signal transduction histidine kinase
MADRAKEPAASSAEERVAAAIAELRDEVEILRDLPEESLRWLAENGTIVDLEPGDVLFKEGDTADELFMFLKGEVQVRRTESGVETRFIGRKGEVSGALPYSRMRNYIGTGFAVFRTRVFRLPKSKFDEMLRRIPDLGQRLISVMADRVRESMKDEMQRDKLMSLGKLSAGLAHELNNPAAAALRAANSLCRTLRELRAANRKLDCRDLTPDQRHELLRVEEEAAQKGEGVELDALVRSDREEEIGRVLERHSIDDPWRLTSSLIDASMSGEQIDAIAESIGADALGDALERIAANVSVERLASEIESSTHRIAELIRSIKEYSFMDQAPIQEVEVRRGLESTLTMMAHELRAKSISVTREFDDELPAIQAYGSELNQVWTNLIDNAIDAMSSGGHLTVRTARAQGAVVVEVLDDGSGIPEDIRRHIFEPFFTTKSVGEGTGLGLDTVYRIVRKHHGEISVQSKPGQTVFTVRLPIEADEPDSNGSGAEESEAIEDWEIENCGGASRTI